MRIQNYRPLDSGDFPEEMQEGFEELLQTLNPLLLTLASAMQNKLSFKDNFLAEVRAIEDFAHDVVHSIQFKRLKRNASAVILLSSSLFDYSKLAWRPSETTPLTIDCKIKWDSAPTTAPDVALLILG